MMDRFRVMLLPLLFISVIGSGSDASIHKSQFLSNEEIEAAVRDIQAGNAENAELMINEERNQDGKTMLRLRSNNREINLELQQTERLIKPNARFVVINGEKERESLFHPSVRTSLYHGSVAESPSGMASLLKNENGWNGLIMTSEQRFVVHGVRGSDRSLLIPMSMKGEDVYSGDAFVEDYLRSEVYNMTGDESFSRTDETEFELEVAVYTDDVLWNYVKNKYPNEDTAKKVQEVALITLNTVHTFYTKPSIGNKIYVVVAGISVMETNPKELQKDNQMLKYLDNFCNWDADVKNPKGTNYDFGLLFSGIDMYGDAPSETGVVGMAPVSRTCLFTSKRSCAIGEGTTYGAGLIMAHEIGHNLGMDHDSSGNSCPGSGFVMGAYISPGATTFSTCSRKYLKDYMQSLDDFGLNCMRDEGNSAFEHSVEGKLPGERVSGEEQCSFALGAGWVPYTQRSDFCAQIYCTDNKSNRLLSPTGGGPPMPGTACGDGKICWSGKCRPRSEVTTIIEGYTPTQSGSSDTALSPDEICAKYGGSYTKGVTYDVVKQSNIRYPDISNMCNQGMICQRDSPLGLLVIQYPAPPGTPCSEDKVCQHFECVKLSDVTNNGGSGDNNGGTGDNNGGSGDNNGESGDNNGGSGDNNGESGDNGGSGDNNGGTGDNNGGSGDNNSGSGDNNGGSGDNNSGSGDNNSGSGDNNGGSGDTDNETPTNTKIVSSGLKKYCRKTIRRSKPADTFDCTRAKCRDRNTVATIPVFNTNICPSKQYCDAGTCTSTKPTTIEGSLEGYAYKFAARECRNSFGKKFRPFCTATNLWAYPELAGDCQMDLCEAILCVGNSGLKFELKPAHPKPGVRCGRRKTCQNFQCQK